MDVYKLRATLGLDASEYEKGLNDSEVSAKSHGDAIGKAFATASKLTLAGVTATATGIGILTKKSVDAYADFEQLVGGVETLFGAGGNSLEEYAESVGKSTEEVRDEYDRLMSAQEIVLNNADNAYKTAGLSANEYMETVTSFAAALNASLGGNTELAAQKADMAISDMSDNANKMGTSMEAIQNAYMGFSKQNFMMLDNLKLGYGGTKTEMERLLADAEKIKLAQGEVADYSIDSYADVVEAIHVVQEEMGITGTTAKEAEQTISGSIAMTKSAWQNLITGIADSEADISKLVSNVLESGEKVVRNIVPVVGQVLKGISQSIEKLAPTITEKLPKLAEEILPPLLDVASNVFAGIVDALPRLIQPIINIIPNLMQKVLPPLVKGVTNLITALAKQLPRLVKSIINVIPQIVRSITDALKQEFPQFESVFNGIAQIIEKVFGVINNHSETVIAVLKTVLAGFIAFKSVVTVFETVKGAIVGVQTALALLSANPITLVATAVGALVGVLALAEASANNTYHAFADLTDEQEALVKAAQDYNSQVGTFIDGNNQIIASIDSQYASEQKLVDELKGIVDENGHVKKGYEERAEVIANQLAEAFGIEITYQDGVIQKYDEVMSKIDEVILKKKAEALLSAGQDEYTEALTKQKDVYEGLKQTQEDLTKTQQEYKKAVEEAKQADEDYNEAVTTGSMTAVLSYSHTLQEANTKVQGLKDKQDELKKSLEEQQQAFYNGQAIIENYESLQESLATGTDDLDRAITSFSNNLMDDAPIQFLRQQAEDAETFYKEILSDYESGEVAISEKQLEQAKSNSEEAKRILEEASKNYKIEGLNAITGYNDEIERGTLTTFDLLKKMTQGGIDTVKTTQDSHSPSRKYNEQGQYAMEGYDLGLKAKFPNVVKTTTSNIKSIVEKWTDLVDSAKTWGTDMIQNFIDGVLEKWEALKSTVSSVAQTVKDYIGFSEPKKGPLSNFHTYAPDMMELFMQGIEANQNRLTNMIADTFDFQDAIKSPEIQSAGNSDVYSLLEQILAYLPQLSNIQLVLDTGILVGETAPKMDEALGQLMTNRARSV